MYIQPIIYEANGYQQDNGDNKKWWKVGLFIAAIILICIIFHGCNPQKKLDREYNHVVSDSGEVQKMRGLIERIYPCIPSQGKEGKTVTVTNTVIDSAQLLILKRKLDSALSISPNEENIDSLKYALLAELQPKIIYSHSLRVDTVPDLQAINLLNDKIASLTHVNDLQSGQLIASHQAFLDEQKKTSAAELQRNIIIGIIILLFVGTIAFKIYSMVTSKTISTAGTTTTGIVSSITNMFKK